MNVRLFPPDSVLALLALELELADEDLVARWCDVCGHVEVSANRALLYAETPCPRCSSGKGQRA